MPTMYSKILIKVLGVSLFVFMISAGFSFSADFDLRWAENQEPDLAGYKIYYKTGSSGPPYDGIHPTNAAFNSPIDVGNVTEYTIAGLNNLEIYYIVLTAYDSEGLESDYSLEYRTEKAPQITSAPTVVSVTDTSAIIQWTTDEAGTSVVEYGPTAIYGSTESQSSYVTNHSIALESLTEGSTYHFRVSSVDAEGYGPGANVADNNPSVDFTFTTSGGGPDETDPVITSIPTVTDTTNNSVTIYWETNEASTSIVEYQAGSAGPPYSETPVTDGTHILAHSITINGLSGSTTYHYRVGSTDASANGPIYSDDYIFTTDPDPDSTDPVISGVTVTGISDSTAIIEWTTDEPATSVVQYGTTSSYGLTQTVAGYAQNHSVTLTDLNGNTLHHFRVASADAVPNGPAYSSDYTFTTEPTPDTFAPFITSPPTVIGTTDTTATIVWDTDEPSNSQVRYDSVSRSWGTYADIQNNADMVTHHTVTISGLISDQTYYFRVGSTDALGYGPDPAYTDDNNPTNNEISFTTEPDATAPAVTSAPTVTGFTDTTATIEWDTDEPGNSQVQYGESSSTWDSYPLFRNGSTMVTHHSVMLTGLTDGQTYYFRVGSTDIDGNGPDTLFLDDNNPSNTELSFTTAPDATDPIITASPTVTFKNNMTATIEWQTDEPSTSLLQYGPDPDSWGSYPSSQNDATMTTSHSVTITGLTGNTPYYFTAGSIDSEGNGPTLSTQVSFTTDPDPDTTAPVITAAPTVTAKSNSTATIEWSTNEPSNSQVRYDETSLENWDSYAFSENDSAMSTIHSVTISGLTGESTYYLMVGSSDAATNGPTLSAEVSFTTDSDPDETDPVLTVQPSVTSISYDTATIQWETDEPGNSVVEYDEDGAPFDYSESDAGNVTVHAVTISDLSGSTMYNYRIDRQHALLFHGRIDRFRR